MKAPWTTPAPMTDEHLRRWVEGDAVACPICRVRVADGDDCPYAHYDAAGGPTDVDEARTAIEELKTIEEATT